MRKYLLMFIICISSFIIYTNNVKASVYTVTRHFTDNYIICQSGFGSCTENLSNAFGAYAGNNLITGTIYFSFVSDPQIILNQVSLNNSAGWFPCNLGTNTIYDDNSTGYILYSATCPVSIVSQGITQIKFTYDDSYINQNSFKFFMGDYYSFYQDLNDTDYTSLLNTINSNLININNTMGGKLDLTYALINNIYNQVTNSNTKLEDIKSKLDSLNSASTNISNNTEQIKNDIKDSSIDNNNATGTINNLSSQLASDNTITSLLLLPINFINVLIDGLSGECVPYSLGELWGTNITMPCVDLYQQFGVIWYMVDTGLSALVIFKMSKYFIRLFNKLTNLKDGGLEEAYS